MLFLRDSKMCWSIKMELSGLKPYFGETTHRLSILEISSFSLSTSDFSTSAGEAKTRNVDPWARWCLRQDLGNAATETHFLAASILTPWYEYLGFGYRLVPQK